MEVNAKVEVNTAKVKGRTQNITSLSSDTAASGGLKVVADNPNEFVLVARTHPSGTIMSTTGTAYVTLSHYSARLLVQDLAQRLGLAVVNATQADSHSVKP